MGSLDSSYAAAAMHRCASRLLPGASWPVSSSRRHAQRRQNSQPLGMEHGPGMSFGATFKRPLPCNAQRAAAKHARWFSGGGIMLQWWQWLGVRVWHVRV